MESPQKNWEIPRKYLINIKRKWIYNYSKAIKKKGKLHKTESKGISEKFEEIAEMYQKIGNLIGFPLFLIRFRVLAFPCHHIYKQYKKCRIIKKY